MASQLPGEKIWCNAGCAVSATTTKSTIPSKHSSSKALLPTQHNAIWQSTATINTANGRLLGSRGRMKTYADNLKIRSERTTRYSTCRGGKTHMFVGSHVAGYHYVKPHQNVCTSSSPFRTRGSEVLSLDRIAPCAGWY